METAQKEASAIKSLNLVAYRDQNRGKPGNRMMDSHIHNQCEIYVNLTGKVSFMVEDRIYGIQRGDVIITRPYEAHHCIYHDTSEHGHFCINFSADNIEEILDIFLERKTGEENLISLSNSEKEELIRQCNTLVEAQNGVQKYIAFFKIIELISGKQQEITGIPLPEDVTACSSPAICRRREQSICSSIPFPSSVMWI